MSVSIYAGNFNKDNNVKETSINYKENVSNRTNGVNGIFNGRLLRGRIYCRWSGN